MATMPVLTRPEEEYIFVKSRVGSKVAIHDTHPNHPNGRACVDQPGMVYMIYPTPAVDWAMIHKRFDKVVRPTDMSEVVFGYYTAPPKKEEPIVDEPALDPPADSKQPPKAKAK